MNPLKEKLENELKVSLPPLVIKLQEGDSSVKDEFASLVLPYIQVLMKAYTKAIESIPSESGWVVMKLLKRIKNIKPDKSVVGYITTTTNNHCIDLYRGQKRKKRAMDKAVELLEIAHPSTLINLTPEFYIDSTTSPDQSEILKYFYVENLDVNEIAALTGETKKYVRSVIEDFKQVEYNTSDI
jgi:hypothetical protein